MHRPIHHIAIVSLSRGILGESFVAHELEIGMKRLQQYGLKVTYMPHALNGLDYVQQHPESRAADLLAALKDPDIDMILCAIGGEDTYRLLPFLFENDALRQAASDKVFLGFSDTTVNHFMLHKIGLNTFYGQCFLVDLCEMDREMLPYTKQFFEELITTGTIRQIRPSDTWYEVRKVYGPDQIGTPNIAHPDSGWELLQGSPVFSGPILGGCLDTIYDFFDGTRFADMPLLCDRYGLFPNLNDWAGKILLLESSEEEMSPEKYRKALGYLKSTGIFHVISGILVGKPCDNVHADAYKAILPEAIGDPSLPILWNLNVGHALPHCIIPFGIPAVVDATAQTISFDSVDSYLV